MYKRQLVDRPVLNYTPIQLSHVQVRLKSFMQKIDLKIKTPSLHIGIKIAQIWIVGNGFVEGQPALSLGQDLCESGFPHTDIARGKRRKESRKTASTCTNGAKQATVHVEKIAENENQRIKNPKTKRDFARFSLFGLYVLLLACEEIKSANLSVHKDGGGRIV